MFSFDQYPTAKLLQNEHFRLVHVQRQGGKMEMSLIAPYTLDRSHQKDILEKGYSCISHIWGNPSQWESWRDHGVIGSDGQPISVPMRPEVQATLHELMRTRGTYWWIDVFCQTGGQFIMGDVFRNCKECYAMTDCDHASLQTFDQLQQIYQTYCSAFLIAEQKGLDITDYTLKVLEKLGRLPFSAVKIPWSSVFEVFWVGSEPPESRVLVENEIVALSSLLSKYWWERVWSLQDVFLPKRTYLLEERGRSRIMVELSTITGILEDIKFLLRKVAKIHEIDHNHCYFHQYDAMAVKLESITSHNLIKLNPKLSGVPDQVRQLIKPLLLRSFSSSTKCAFAPIDYIYSVLGILDIDIPFHNDPDNAWIAFKEALHTHNIHVEKDVDLINAKCMGDVFQQFCKHSC